MRHLWCIYSKATATDFTEVRLKPDVSAPSPPFFQRFLIRLAGFLTNKKALLNECFLFWAMVSTAHALGLGRDLASYLAKRDWSRSKFSTFISCSISFIQLLVTHRSTRQTTPRRLVYPQELYEPPKLCSYSALSRCSRIRYFHPSYRKPLKMSLAYHS